MDDGNGKDAGSVRVISGRNPVGTNDCGPPVANSTGLPAAILAIGNNMAVDNLLWLRATNVIPANFGFFIASETQGFSPAPGGSQGNLCLAGQIGRFQKQVQQAGSGGNFTINVDLTSIPTNPSHSVLAGETWNFQAWYRDGNPGPTSNFTDAVSVLFQ